MDVELLREYAWKLYMRKEELLPTDLPAKSFKHHLELLEQDELLDVLIKLKYTRELEMGWHSLDEIYGTRTRRAVQRNANLF